MNRVLIILTAFYFVLHACSQPSTIEEVTDNATLDSLKVDERDTLMYRVGKNWKPGPHFHQVKFPDSVTSVEWTEIEGKLERVSAMIYGDTLASWVTGFLDNNELKLVRFRQWKAKPQAQVTETFTYLENGKPFFTKERTRILKEGDDIGSYRDEAFVKNPRPAEQLMAEYGQLWELAQETIKKDQAARKQ